MLSCLTPTLTLTPTPTLNPALTSTPTPTPTPTLTPALTLTLIPTLSPILTPTPTLTPTLSQQHQRSHSLAVSQLGRVTTARLIRNNNILTPPMSTNVLAAAEKMTNHKTSGTKSLSQYTLVSACTCQSKVWSCWLCLCRISMSMYGVVRNM